MSAALCIVAKWGKSGLWRVFYGSRIGMWGTRFRLVPFWPPRSTVNPQRGSNWGAITWHYNCGQTAADRAKQMLYSEVIGSRWSALYEAKSYLGRKGGNFSESAKWLTGTPTSCWTWWNAIVQKSNHWRFRISIWTLFLQSPKLWAQSC